MAKEFDFFTRIEGSEALRKTLRGLGAEARAKYAKVAIQELVKVLGPSMKRRARRRTGRLKEGIPEKAKNIRKTRDGASFKLGPTKEAFWALFLEFGTIKMPAFPFMRPAVDQDGERAVRNALKLVERMLERDAKRIARRNRRVRR